MTQDINSLPHVVLNETISKHEEILKKVFKIGLIIALILDLFGNN